MSIRIKQLDGEVAIELWARKDVEARHISVAKYFNVYLKTHYSKPSLFFKNEPVANMDTDRELLFSSSVGGKQSAEFNASSFWFVDGKVYQANDKGLTLADVKALINVDTNKRRLQLEKAHAMQAMVDNLDGKRKRSGIPQNVRLEVWQRDGGRCVECSSQQNLEFDHIIPHSMGGADTVRNLQLLCETCNRRKGASLG